MNLASNTIQKTPFPKNNEKNISIYKTTAQKYDPSTESRSFLALGTPWRLNSKVSFNHMSPGNNYLLALLKVNTKIKYNWVRVFAAMKEQSRQVSCRKIMKLL